MLLQRAQYSLVLALSLASGASATPVPAPELADAQLRAINHRFVDSFVADTGAFMDNLVSPDFLRTAGDGSWQQRDAFLASFNEENRIPGASYDQVQTRVFGTVALTHAVFEALMSDGRRMKVRYTDVYHWNGNQWALVSGQNSVMSEGVPVAIQTATAPVHEPWSGRDPIGDDDSVLVSLNESYVDAFRRADVAWYDAHLAADYLVISSDGSIKDRAAALADFARPVFATQIASFPVDKVRIRRFDDVALIHAENAFEMKDGRTGISRYTDIWVKRDGQWRCVAAHITARKSLSAAVD